MDVDAVTVTGVWWRQIPHGADPLGLLEPPSDGRWQRGETIEALYFADDEETVWAEWYRALAEFALPPARQLPRDLWRWELSIERIANLSSEEKLQAVGLLAPRPDRHTWSAFQEVGHELHSAGFRGVLYPSAARPAAHALCLFRVELEVPGAIPLRPPVAHRDPPPSQGHGSTQS